MADHVRGGGSHAHDERIGQIHIVADLVGVSAQAGLQNGDVIIGLNQMEISNIRSFERALQNAKGNIALLVRRQDSTLYVPLRLN